MVELAATRLIALHKNKGKSVAACLKSRTDYAQNPDKTQQGELVSSYECSPLTVDEEFMLSKRQYELMTGRRQKNDVIAYQIRQSFKPGEITAEEANKVGYELAMNITQRMYFGQSPLDKDRDRRIAFYGRVSTQHEAQVDALGNQMQWYDDQLRYHPNWQVINRYIDEGITGTSAKKRPAFMQMISDAKRGKFDLIVTREVCRFARNTVDTLQLTRELRNFGVEVFFVSDNIWTMDGDGELRLSIMATMAQEESRKISERVLAGQKISRQKGVLYGSGNIIGYDRDNAKRTYVINEEQAATIRMVFTLYSQGYGEKAIVNELSRLGCKDGHGNVSWSCTKISRILRNATYMGYICYNKSKVNNYLEKKRINNLDEDSFVYVKGNFEPIVSESLWHECERIRKSRISSLRLPDGETRRKGTKTTKNLWVSKLRCRCGSSYRIFKWRKLKDGTPVFGYQCNMRTVNPTRSFVLEHGLTDQLSCDAISVPEWKLDLMAKKIFEKVWGNQNKAILLACQMIEGCKSGKPTTLISAAPIQSKIEKIKNRKMNYAAMRADGELGREEYQALCKQADDEINRLEQDLKSIAPEPDSAAVSANMKALHDFLEQKLDVRGACLAPELIEQFVEVVTPISDYTYRWKLNTGSKKEKHERADLMAVTGKPVLTFTIDFETAKKYREANKMPHQFRRAAWSDLTVEVYL